MPATTRFCMTRRSAGVTLRTPAHTYVLDEALSDLEQRVGERFLRVHRNALVARHAVRALERRVIAGEGDDEGSEDWKVLDAIHVRAHGALIPLAALRYIRPPFGNRRASREDATPAIDADAAEQGQ